MKIGRMTVVAAALLAPSAVLAQGAFDGTWKVDASTAHLPPKPEVIALQDGVFSCSTCTPPFQVKADGAFHPVTGIPYADMMSVKVIDPMTVRSVRMKGGREAGSLTEVVSADGQTLTLSYVDKTVAGVAPVTGTSTLVRMQPGPAGSAPISGAWRQTKMEGSDNGMMFSYRSMGGKVMYSTPSGQSYTAMLDGTPAPFMGDPGVNTVSVVMQGGSMVETDMRAGKPISVTTMTVSPDGRTMAISSDDKMRGETSSITAVKQ